MQQQQQLKSMVPAKPIALQEPKKLIVAGQTVSTATMRPCCYPARPDMQTENKRAQPADDKYKNLHGRLCRDDENQLRSSMPSIIIHPLNLL